MVSSDLSRDSVRLPMISSIPKNIVDSSYTLSFSRFGCSILWFLGNIVFKFTYTQPEVAVSTSCDGIFHGFNAYYGCQI
jgi:hypothetical protein